MMRAWLVEVEVVELAEVVLVLVVVVVLGLADGLY